MTTTTTRSARRIGRTCAAALAACAVLAACGGNGESGGEPVTFLNVLPLESLSFAPEMIADTRGLFEARGLDVTFEATQGSAPAIQTVLAGGAELTRIGDIETMIAAGERDAPLLAFGEPIHTGTIRMISTEAAPITRAEQFRGRLVGTPSEGGTSSITLDLVAGSAGVPPEEVPRQVVGLSPGVFDLLTSGRVDAYIVSLDTSVLLDRTRPEAVVYDPNQDVDAGAQMYVTSAEQMADPQTRDRLERYAAAVEEAMQFIIDDEANGFAETMRLIGSEYEVPALADPEVATAALSAYVDAYTAGDTLLGVSPERWQAAYDEIVGIGQLPPGLDPGAWLDTTLTSAAPTP
ncbi:ABC transporter substrate-binding protein [Pseudonocardia sp. NPDC046786]|uniref:ABC transporter substrate-binding protein n=1 Tax=Pseudonocardia sp. NPDC046786 TaxID=3155471 RepID=UPI0033CAD509